MRVIVLSSFGLGGAERQALLLARQWVLDGQRVCVCAPGPDGPVTSACRDLGIRSLVLPPIWGGRRSQAFRLFRVAAALRGIGPTVLLPYIHIPNVVCGAIWRATGANGCIWNQRDEGLSPDRGLLQRHAVRNTSRFVANSSMGRRYLLDRLGAPPERVVLVRNGVDLAPPKASRAVWRSWLGVGRFDVAVTMVANLTSTKDHLTLLRAWSIVQTCMAAHSVRAWLLLAGREGDTAFDVRLWAQRLGLQHCVRFLGAVHDVAGLLQASDVAVLSSHSEGCPNCVLESMACGLPVAGTDIVGIRETIDPSGYPFLAPASDAEALAGCLVALISDPERRHMLGQIGLERARSIYSVQRMCSEIDCLIADIL